MMDDLKSRTERILADLDPIQHLRNLDFPRRSGTEGERKAADYVARVLEQNGISLPEQIRAAAELSDYAVEARYPAPIEPVTEDEYKEAVRLAEMVVSWVDDLITSTTERTTDS